MATIIGTVYNCIISSYPFLAVPLLTKKKEKAWRQARLWKSSSGPHDRQVKFTDKIRPNYGDESYEFRINFWHTRTQKSTPIALSIRIQKSSPRSPRGRITSAPAISRCHSSRSGAGAGASGSRGGSSSNGRCPCAPPITSAATDKKCAPRMVAAVRHRAFHMICRRAEVCAVRMQPAQRRKSASGSG